MGGGAPSEKISPADLWRGRSRQPRQKHQLKDKYRDVFGESSGRRALEIANDADLRIRAPKNLLKEDLDQTRTIEARVAPTEDPRLPMPGTELVRRYRGKMSSCAFGRTASSTVARSTVP